jgi:hypothetical protein
MHRYLLFILVASSGGALCAGCGDSTQQVPDAASNCPDNEPPAAPTPPAARTGFAYGFDGNTEALYVFGGDVGTGQACAPQPVPAGDTWRYSLRCHWWINVNPPSAPPARSGAASAVEGPPVTQNRLIVFGGRGSSGLLNDVWALDLQSFQWLHLPAAGTPPAPREFATASFHATDDEILIFGGNTSEDAANPTPQNDLWSFSLIHNEWKQISAAGTPPPPRWRHARAFDQFSRNLYVGFGSAGPTDPPLRDLYIYDVGTARWRGGPSASGPSARTDTAMDFDQTSNQVVLFGGRDDGTLGFLNDYWTYNPGIHTWMINGSPDTIADASGQPCSRPADFVTVTPMTPERRASMLFVFASVFPFIYGGTGDCGKLDDVWNYLVNNAWVPLTPATIGESCAHSGRSGCSSLCQ